MLNYDTGTVTDGTLEIMQQNATILHSWGHTGNGTETTGIVTGDFYTAHSGTTGDWQVEILETVTGMSCHTAHELTG